jgi:branched-chain amino acid transport system substrate-binding protein
VRRRRGRLAAALTSVGFLVALAALMPAGAQPATPIKIGVVLPATGPLAVNGMRAADGIRLFFQSKDWQVAGRKIEIIREDDETKPDVGLTKTKKVVERDRAHALIAFISTPVTYAARDYITAQKIPSIIMSGANALIHPGSPTASPYMFRIFNSLYGNGKGLAEWVHGKAGLKRVVVVALNFGGAIEPAFAFKYTFQRLGGQIVAEIQPPLGTADWGPWISQIAAATASADGVIAYVYAADAIRMVKAWVEFGLKGKVPLYGGEAFTSEMLLAAMGDTAEGLRQFGSYCPTLTTPENQQLARAVKGIGQYPAEYNFYGWAAAQTMWEALRVIGGRAEDHEALARALQEIRYVGASGPFRYDAHRNPILDVYMQEVRRVDGELHNVCLDKVAEVGHPSDVPFPPK